ncbi:amino acid permease family protein [Synechococcus sp. MIT S9220]|uniref:APC family permease n=1 Tax=unclassified Synechococcus TaxID=2626047 RepID=UPI001818FBC3|nr:APC family permease [Synechococcus sp. MIT S9220]NOL47655.1 APC family permease [Synechococcus sp. MIT S9220]QNJ21948.1 amino acid permease family protein [Synechococcus sp. MIT S9220]
MSVPSFSRLLGRPLPRSSAKDERLPNLQALPILSSDALSSVAYATEAALGILILGGSAALRLSLPITVAIIALITIVVLSYRQAISAYPNGGGSYVVARDNLGRNVGLVAAAALLIDYTLTAAVSLMAGTQALSSLDPALLAYEVPIALFMLLLVGWANLRGVKEAGRVFSVPTYAFVVMIVLLTVAGLKDLTFHHGWTPDAPPLTAALQPIGLFLVLRAFSSGCSAMTGIEAIANGVQVFKEPAPVNARKTLLVMSVLLSVMFLAVSTMGFMYGVAPNPDITVLAQIGQRVFGDGSVLYWTLQISTLLILVLAANTAFSGFPRLAAMLAEDHCLPMQMKLLGDRLVYQNGISALVVITALIIVICRGDTTVAVNLYALGVFTAFTLSQLGLVCRWWKRRGEGWRGRMAMNALGSLTTFVVLLVIVVSKFDEGAWTVVIAIPLLVWGLALIRRRYREIFAALALDPDGSSLKLIPRDPPTGHHAIVWVASMMQPSFEALRYACSFADSVTAVMVVQKEEDAGQLSQLWDRYAGTDTGALELVLLDSPYSSLLDPFCDFVMEQEQRHPERTTTVVMPVAIPRDRLDVALLNQRARSLFEALSTDQSRVFSIVRYFVPRLASKAGTLPSGSMD